MEFLQEIIAPVMLIIGFRARLAGLIFAANCFTATVLAQTANIFKLNEFGGWALELLAIYMLIGISFSLPEQGNMRFLRGVNGIDNNGSPLIFCHECTNPFLFVHSKTFANYILLN
jgi:hypothetical protein